MKSAFPTVALFDKSEARVGKRVSFVTNKKLTGGGECDTKQE